MWAALRKERQPHKTKKVKRSMKTTPNQEFEGKSKTEQQERLGAKNETRKVEINTFF
jgi:hypothetical protein